MPTHSRSGRFKLEIMNLPNADATWFDTREELDSHVKFLQECPVDDGPIRLKITEYGIVKEVVLEPR